ncbi:MAG: hypothetical protein ACI3V0_12830 [Faecousia sp.]
MKTKLKLFWKKRKKPVLAVTAVVLAVAIGCGVWYQAGHNPSEPVYVFPFQYVGMTQYWGDVQESYGPVRTDKIQTVFLSDTQTITEILVQPGDTVKKDDLLMTFDTTLSDLQLERKRLDVEKLKLQLEDAKDELKHINSLKPMVIPSTPDNSDEEEGSGAVIDGPELYPLMQDVTNRMTYDGSAVDKALIYWILDSTAIDDDLFRAAERHAAQIQAANIPEETDPTEPDETEPTVTDPSETDSPETDPPVTDSQETDPPKTETSTEETEEEGDSGRHEQQEDQEPELPPLAEDQSAPSNASEAETPELSVGSHFYVVIKVTSGNREEGDKKVWQCLKVTKKNSGYSFTFADTLIPDYSAASFWWEDDSSSDGSNSDLGSGYTASQIAQLRSDQLKKIKDLEFQIKMADAEYQIMLKEVGDGNIYADSDGKVISVLTEEEAKQSNQPILKVSGGGGFYIEGFINELEKENMKLGQEVTVNDWNTGMTYTGTIDSMGDFPTREGYYNGNGNPNASYYPFQVFVDETADLQAGSYVSVQYSNAESKNGIYLENPFLRTELGRSYVYVLGPGGKLEQRWVTTGKSLWGNYTEILSGMTAEDLVAFPYGKNVKPGVAAQEGDLSNLYG